METFIDNKEISSCEGLVSNPYAGIEYLKIACSFIILDPPPNLVINYTKYHFYNMESMAPQC